MKTAREICQPVGVEMGKAILELRARGDHALADDLTRVRDAWLRLIARLIDRGNAA